MAGMVKLVKQKIFPNVHDLLCSYTMSMENGNNRTVQYPIIMQDEALIARDLETNPRNASFVESNAPNCYPETEIDFIKGQAIFTLTKGFFETDKLHVLRFATMDIHTAFLEDLTPIDELSTLEIKDILHLDNESTDKQCYPLWNGTKVPEKYTGSATLDALQPGLT